MKKINRFLSILMALIISLISFSVFISCNNDNDHDDYDDEIIDDYTGPTYSVNFDLNGGTGNTSNQKVPRGEGLRGYCPPTKSDKLFTGWSTEKDDLSTKIGPDFLVKRDITLYAVWEDSSPQAIVQSAALNSAYYAYGVKFEHYYDEDEDYNSYYLLLQSGGNFKASYQNHFSEDSTNLTEAWYTEQKQFYFVEKIDETTILDAFTHSYIISKKSSLYYDYIRMIHYGNDFNFSQNTYTFEYSNNTYNVEITSNKINRIYFTQYSTSNYEINFFYNKTDAVLPALPDVNWQNRYLVNLNFSNGVKTLLGTEYNPLTFTDFIPSNLNFEAYNSDFRFRGYSFEGIYWDTGYTDKITDSEIILEADTTFYIKLNEKPGDIEIISRAVSKTLNLTDYEFCVEDTDELIARKIYKVENNELHIKYTEYKNGNQKWEDFIDSKIYEIQGGITYKYSKYLSGYDIVEDAMYDLSLAWAEVADQEQGIYNYKRSQYNDTLYQLKITDGIIVEYEGIYFYYSYISYTLNTESTQMPDLPII